MPSVIFIYIKIHACFNKLYVTHGFPQNFSQLFSKNSFEKPLHEQKNDNS